MTTTIILEGPDGAGKTRLAARLRQWLGDETGFVHHGAYLGEQQIANHYLAPLLGSRRLAREGVGEPLLMDRSWLAEPIYGKAMRNGENRLKVWQRRMLERVFLGLGGVVVLCLPPFDTCRSTWQGRLQSEYPREEEQLRAVWDGYHAAIAEWRGRGLSVLVYDYEVDPLTWDLMPRLIDTIWRVRNLGPGDGGWHEARWLLIGDQPNAPDLDQPAFISDHEGGCSAWLAERLEEWDVGEHRLHWVNQRRLQARSFARFGGVNGAFDNRVVALGHEALAWCEMNRVEATHVAHPQYWKRFRFNDTYPLKEVLC